MPVISVQPQPARWPAHRLWGCTAEPPGSISAVPEAFSISTGLLDFRWGRNENRPPMDPSVGTMGSPAQNRAMGLRSEQDNIATAAGRP